MPHADGSPQLERGKLSRPDLIRDKAYVNGQWIAADGGAVIDVDDPFTGEIIGHAPSLSEQQARSSIDAAERAFPAWAKVLTRNRGAILRRWFDLVIAHQEDLARLITLENGKPLKEARAEVAYGAGFIEFYADEAGRMIGEIIPAPVAGRRLMVEPEPIGVCAAITPWNFPLAMLTRKAAPALAAGCTIIAKPASQTPLSAYALAVLAEEAGVPAGVLNVITGKASMIGKLLTSSPVVRKISFTGSTEIGAQLMEASAPLIKRLSLELGGNAPLLIFDDADLETAVETALVAKFRNSGQSCIAANRIYAQKDICESFLDAFAERVNALAPGDGFDERSDIGPLIDKAGVAKVEEHLDDAVKGGATILAGGKSSGGQLMPPTLVRDVAPDALLTSEETFGPLAGVIPFETMEEGVALANNTPFGLAAYLCSENPATIARAGRDIESGMVGINTGLISTAVVPFGGVKMSGLGREGSSHGLAEYLNLKYLCQAGL
ncbi:NAD-dependent succinate-semialdehyde dehydrogenase [Marinicaulis aureus]|uniref:NAD-dependent succinate-semialdehyde dehydrogenase n=1 Tax=Hyphococcus aureus TaxID=2666033 RepID=A0ABW1KX83_9PROT